MNFTQDQLTQLDAYQQDIFNRVSEIVKKEDYGLYLAMQVMGIVEDAACTPQVPNGHLPISSVRSREEQRGVVVDAEKFLGGPIGMPSTSPGSHQQFDEAHAAVVAQQADTKRPCLNCGRDLRMTHGRYADEYQFCSTNCEGVWEEKKVEIAWENAKDAVQAMKETLATAPVAVATAEPPKSTITTDPNPLTKIADLQNDWPKGLRAFQKIEANEDPSESKRDSAKELARRMYAAKYDLQFVKDTTGLSHATVMGLFNHLRREEAVRAQ